MCVVRAARSRYVCGTNELYSRAAVLAAAVCWSQWLQLALMLEHWVDLLRAGGVGVCMGCGVAITAAASAAVWTGGLLCGR